MSAFLKEEEKEEWRGREMKERKGREKVREEGGEAGGQTRRKSR